MQISELKIEKNEKYGVGLWWKGHFFYWRQTTNRSAIFLNRLKKRADQILNFTATFIVVLGFISLFYWFYINLDAILDEPLKILQFWAHKSIYILFFLVSVCFLLFLIYRKTEAKLLENRISRRHFKEDSKSQDVYHNASILLNDKLDYIIDEAFLIAHKFNQGEVSILHFFRASLSEQQVQNVFIRLGVDAEAFITKLDRNILTAEQEGQINLSPNLQKTLLMATLDAVERRQEEVEPINVLLYCYKNDELLAEILYDLNIDEDKLKNACEWMHINEWISRRYRLYRKAAAFKPGSNMDRAYTAIATPTLDHFGHDLTLNAKYGRLELCVGREAEINNIFELMEGGNTGVLLIGASGAGKSIIINGLAQLMVEEKVPIFLQDKRLVEVDVARLVSGASPEDAKARLLACINETAKARNIVLHIANIENLVAGGFSGGDSLDLSEVLAEALDRKLIFCIATVNSENYSNFLENSALGEVMSNVLIKEPDVNQAILMLESKVAALESRYQVFINYNAIEQAVKMSSRYIHDQFLPKKAVNLLQLAVIDARKKSRGKKIAVCNDENIATAISELTGVPLTQLTADESQKLLSLEKKIHERMIGQEEAVIAVSASLRRSRAALRDSSRPISSFLFLGPTGVGKTELAKTVSDVYFGDEDYMVRLDMSEYQHADSVKKMIGDVDGTQGYLTEAVRKKPFSLILLDEIEKAHPDILNLFLQLLDDGRLTDGKGRTIKFSESIIIATSNIGALYIQKEIKAGTGIEHIKKELVDNYLNKHMRPELINRFDGIVVFKPLSEDHIYSIATIMLKKIKKRLEIKGIGLQADKAGVLKLAQEGYDPQFGARPLRRLLQEKVEDEIANLILASKLKRRDTVIINRDASINVLRAKKL